MRQTRKRGGGMFNWLKPKGLKNRFTWKKKTQGSTEHSQPNYSMALSPSPTRNFFKNQNLKEVYKLQQPKDYSLFNYQEKNKVERKIKQPNLSKLKVTNNSYLNNAFGKPTQQRVSDYEVINNLQGPPLTEEELLAHNRAYSNYMNVNTTNNKRREENRTTANVDLTDCNYLKTLSYQEISDLVAKDKLRIESIQQTFDRVYVFLYLKLKENPILNDESINDSYTMPNDERFPLKLNKPDFDELRNIIIQNEDKRMDEIAVELFKTDLKVLDEQIVAWEKRNKAIYRNNECYIGNKAGGDLGRTIGDIRLTETERKNKINRDDYGCLSFNSQTDTINTNCIFITNKLDALAFYPQNKMYWICIHGTQAAFTTRYDKFSEIRIVKQGFMNGDIAGINPRLGFVLQNEHPDLWAQKMWIPERKMDIMDRIVILTLQKYSAIRRYYGSSYIPPKNLDRVYDQSWCSSLYKSNPFDPYIAYELKNPQIRVAGYNMEFNEEEFIEELIDNQVWVRALNENHYKKLKKSNNTYGIPYRTLKDLDKLLPTPPGFKPNFFWQIYDSKNKSFPKTEQRHKNVLYTIAGLKSDENAKIARNLGNTWTNIEKMKHSPQFATQSAINKYYRNFGIAPRLTNIQRMAPKPPRRTLNASSRRVFAPTQIRRTRKSRR